MVALPPRALPFSLLYSTLAPEFLFKEILGHKQKILDSDRGVPCSNPRTLIGGTLDVELLRNF